METLRELPAKSLTLCALAHAVPRPGPPPPHPGILETHFQHPFPGPLPDLIQAMKPEQTIKPLAQHRYNERTCITGHERVK